MIEIDYLYVAMIKGLLSDQNYALVVTEAFQPEYFQTSEMVEIFKNVKSHVSEFKTLPDRDIIINSISSDIREKVIELFREVDNTDFDVAKNYDWLKTQTNKYLKEQAIKQSIIKSVDIIDSGGDYDEIKRMVEEAICKDIDIYLGLDYFGTLQERIRKILTTSDQRVKTYYPSLDELFNGGYPPYTLNMMIAKIHGHKCVSTNTLVYLRDNITGNIKNIKIGDFYKYIYKDVFIGGLEMPSLEQFQNKYGEVEGRERYDSWIEKLRNKRPSPSTKGMSKLELFQNKYGEVEGRERYDSWMQKNIQNGKKGKGRGTLSWYISKYGEVEGKERYDKKCENISNSIKGLNSLQWFIDRYGEVEGKERYDEKCFLSSDKGRGSLQWFIDRYGEVEGKERYDEYIYKQQKSHSLKGYIEKYGNVEGAVLWNKRCSDISKRGTLEGYIVKYGEVEGKERYDERQNKWMNTIKSKSPEEIEDIIRRRILNGRFNGFSKMSQDLFFILYDEIKKDFSDIRFAMLNPDGDIDDSGFNNEKFLSHDDRNMFIDFYIGDIMKVIEFDGDYWHGESRGNKTLDKDRDKSLIDNGYDVLHIRERDYNNDCDYVIKTCLDFIYG